MSSFRPKILQVCVCVCECVCECVCVCVSGCLRFGLKCLASDPRSYKCVCVCVCV